MNTSTIGTVASQILQDLAPDELDYLDVVGNRVFADGAEGRRVRLAALSPRTRSSPTAFGPESTEMIAGFVLSLLNGMACEILADQALLRAGSWRRRWITRRVRRRVAAVRARDAMAAPLPRLPAVEAERIGQEAFALGLAAGIPEEKARRLSIRLSAALIVEQP